MDEQKTQEKETAAVQEDLPSIKSDEKQAEAGELEHSGHVAEVFVKVEQELKELEDRYLRLAAEFENFKIRAERERGNAIKFANERLLVEILPVLDNLEHAVVAANAGLSKEGASDNFKTVVTGVDMVLKQFRDVLQRFQIEEFSALGQKFDPAKHEALAEKESDAEKGMVVEEMQKGYILNGRLVRAARVIVSKGPPKIE